MTSIERFVPCRPRLRLCQPQSSVASPSFKVHISLPLGFGPTPRCRFSISDINPSSAHAQARPWRRPRLAWNQRPPTSKRKTDRERLQAIGSSNSANPNGHRARNDRQRTTARLSAKSNSPSTQAATDSILRHASRQQQYCLHGTQARQAALPGSSYLTAIGLEPVSPVPEGPTGKFRAVLTSEASGANRSGDRES